MSTIAPPISTSRMLASSAGSMLCNILPGSKGPCVGAGFGAPPNRFQLQPPAELISPVASPNTAIRTHCIQRKGAHNCWRVCSKALLTTSTADFGKVTLLLLDSRADPENYFEARSG